MLVYFPIFEVLLTLSFTDTCVISRVRYLLYSDMCNLTDGIRNRDPRRGWSLCLGDALWDRKNCISAFFDRGIPTVLPRAPQADILFP